MKLLAEGTLFLGVATALHVALWQGLPAGGTEGAGEGGRASLSVTGADMVLAAMVAEWEQAPATGPAAPSAVSPPVESAPPVPPSAAVPAVPPVAATPPVISAPPPMRDEALAPSPPPPLPAPEPTMTDSAPAESPRPVARPAALPPPTETAPARRAEGAGAGETRGSRAATEAPGQSAAARQTALAEWGGRIRARIDRARPRVAGRGAVTLSLTVARDGRLLAASVVAGSGQPALDRAALQAVTGAGRFPEAPAALRDASYSFRLPVRFD